MLNNKIKLAVLTALLAPTITFAADVTNTNGALQNQNPVQQTIPLVKPQISPKSIATANELADINERMSLLDAKLSEIKLQTDIAEKRNELRKATAPTASLTDDSFVPSVMDIDGIDGKLKASLYVHGGNTQSVRVGDKVGAWKVKEIKMDSVTVQKGKEVIRLGFGTYAPEPVIAGAGNTMQGSPQFPR